MKYTAAIEIEPAEAKIINKYMHEEPTDESDCLGEDETITHTAVFSNGYQMDIKCCGVQYNENETTNTAWSEAVLFDKQNNQIAYTEPCDTYFGEWQLEANGNEYTANVIEAK